MHSASVRLSIVAIVICFGVAGTLTAQVPRGSEFARAQQTSNAAMRGYSWKSRTELKLNRMIVNGPTYQARGGGADARLGG